MTAGPSLGAQAHGLAAHLPPLLASAEHLALAVMPGSHGRRRAGAGDDFWQYRAAQPLDSRRLIDHRRSAMGDAEYVREREWQIAQSVVIWVDPGAAMRFASGKGAPTKAGRAQLLALACAILLIQGGERVGHAGTLAPRRGRAQIAPLANALMDAVPQDHATLDAAAVPAGSTLILFSDFLGDLEGIRAVVAQSAARGGRGVLYQILDPAEETFPFQGRTHFESPSGQVRHKTLKASDLRARYCARLHQRQETLAGLADRAGWQFGVHRTDRSAQSALLWLYHALAGDRR